MQRWKLIIIFTRPGDNYRPTVPEFVDGVARQEDDRARQWTFRSAIWVYRIRRRRDVDGGEWEGRGEVIELAGLRIAALLTLFAVTPSPLAVFRFLRRGCGIGLTFRLLFARARANIFSQPAWQSYSPIHRRSCRAFESTRYLRRIYVRPILSRSAHHRLKQRERGPTARERWTL